MSNEQDNGQKDKSQDDLLTFIKETAKEKYAEIEQSSLPYVCIMVETEYIEVDDEDYYYSVN